MTIKQIRESGLLELYVLGDLNQEDRNTVVATLIKYPELLEDVRSIESGLKFYGKIHAVNPHDDTYKRILAGIVPTDFANEKGSDTQHKDLKKGNNLSNLVWPILLVATFIAGFWYFNNLNNTLKESEKALVDCRKAISDKDLEISILQQISNPNNQILLSTATEKFPSTKAYLHNDETADKTFLQVQNLPPIAENQSYQLWSLKGDDAPIPLDVFEPGSGPLFEIQHVEATNVYAITIEPKGGQDSPTLENLIATFKVS